MSIFNPIMLKEIINKYFNKQFISNYEFYDVEFYFLLSDIFNNIYESEYYLSQCNQFLNLSKDIDFNNLLKDIPILLEYQPIILLFYKILEQLNMIDTNIYINDSRLINEIFNNNNFYFLVNITNEINIDKINMSLSKFNLS